MSARISNNAARRISMKPTVERTTRPDGGTTFRAGAFTARLRDRLDPVQIEAFGEALEKSFRKSRAQRPRIEEPPRPKVRQGEYARLEARWYEWINGKVDGAVPTSRLSGLFYRRGLFTTDAAAALGWAPVVVKLVAQAVPQWTEEELKEGRKEVSRRVGRRTEREVISLVGAEADLVRWVFSKPVIQTTPETMICRASYRDALGKQLGMPCLFYWPKGHPGWEEVAHPMLAALNDRFEKI